LIKAFKKLDFPELVAPRTRQLNILRDAIYFSPTGKISLGREIFNIIASVI
jgi:hypothetical protein